MQEQAVRDVLADHMGPDATVLFITHPGGGRFVLAVPARLAAEVIAAYRRDGFRIDTDTRLPKAS